MTKLPLLLTIAVISIGTMLVYADEFNMIFGAEAFVRDWLEVKFEPVETGGVDVRVIHTSLFHFDNIIAMPEQFTVTHEKAGGGTEILMVEVKPTWKKMITFEEPEIETQITIPQVTPEIQAKIDEERAEQERLFFEAIICNYGVGAESVFQAEKEVIVLKDMEYFKHLPTSYRVRALILATEACDAFEGSYLKDYPQYRDIAEDQKTDIVPFVLDETDSPLTDPVTQRDLDDETQRAMDFQCSVAGKQRGLCVNGDVGFPETNYPEGKACQIRPVEPGITAELMCPLASLNSYLTTTSTEDQQWEIVQQLVCDTYLIQYGHLVERIQAGDETAELPGWLEHCELPTDD